MAIVSRSWLLGVLMLAGCTLPPPVEYAPRDDVEFRLMVDDASCFACREFQFSRADVPAHPVFLGPPILRARDIRAITMSSLRDERGLVVHFAPASVKKVERVTRENVGRDMAILADGQVLTLATIQSPFGDSMQLAGLDEAELARYHLALTGGTELSPGDRTP